MRKGDSHAQRLGSVESGQPVKGDCTLRGFEQEGKAIFQGKVKRKKKEHEAARTEDETENDAPDDEVEGVGQKRWWKRGDVEAKLNTVNMTAWVHKECDVIEEEALTTLQEAWDSSEQKDECIVRVNDLEGAYWMGTEIGQLGGAVEFSLPLSRRLVARFQFRL